MTIPVTEHQGQQKTQQNTNLATTTTKESTILISICLFDWKRKQFFCEQVFCWDYTILKRKYLFYFFLIFNFIFQDILPFGIIVKINLWEKLPKDKKYFLSSPNVQFCTRPYLQEPTLHPPYLSGTHLRESCFGSNLFLKISNLDHENFNAPK